MTDTVLDDLTHGDEETLAISGLTDDDGNPATFGASDVLRWTAKSRRTDDDVDALIAKSSADDIAFTVGGSDATVSIFPADYPDFTTERLSYFWDLQLARGGSSTDIRTLARGTGRIIRDVTRTAP